MRIAEIKSQHRRDFSANVECDHDDCDYTGEIIGYDDRNFHENVVPLMKRPSCGRIAKSTYRPLATKYSDDADI